MGKYIYKLKDGSKLQMFCVPYLGGYMNSFSKLVNYINQDIEIWSFNSPGHGNSSEKPLDDIDILVTLFYEELQNKIKLPYILFGYSMGAIIAYFLLQKIYKKNSDLKLPAAIVLCACNSPAYFYKQEIETWSDQQVLERLNSYQGIPDSILQEQSLLKYFLPVYRADFMILKSAAKCEYSPINVPAYYLWGNEDKVVSISEVYHWSNYFSNAINFSFIEGEGHMFINQNVKKLVDRLNMIFCDI